MSPLYSRGELCAMAALIVGIVFIWVTVDLAGGIGRAF